MSLQIYNGRGLYYPVKTYSKGRDVMTLRDPHTGKLFELTNASKTLKFSNYKVIKR